MSDLVPCPECGRHVRVTETVCPFCALSLDLSSSVPPVLPAQRLSRAATLAYRATIASATALAACSSVPVYGAPGPIGGQAGAEEAGAAAGGASGATADAGRGGANVGPVYGAPAGGAPPQE